MVFVIKIEIDCIAADPNVKHSSIKSF